MLPHTAIPTVIYTGIDYRNIANWMSCLYVYVLGYVYGRVGVGGVSYNVKPDRCELFLFQINYEQYSHIYLVSDFVKGRLCDLTGSMLDHRSPPPEFESRCWHIWIGVSSFTSLHYLWRLLGQFKPTNHYYTFNLCQFVNDCLDWQVCWKKGMAFWWSLFKLWLWIVLSGFSSIHS